MRAFTGVRAHAARTARPCRSVYAQAEKPGFGKTGTLKKQGKKPGRRIEDELADDAMDGAVIARRGGKPRGDYWFKAANLSEFRGKDKRAVTTRTGTQVMLYLHNDVAYCSDAKGTAYEFPLVDATIIDQKGSESPLVQVPLDGTTYELLTGKVVEWCPKNNPLRAFLGTLKSNQTPTDLKVYSCVLTDEDEIWVKLV